MTTDVDARPGEQDATGIGRFQTRSVLGGAALLTGAVPFLLLWLLVQHSWSPLAALDAEVATALNAEVRDSPLLVSLLRVVTELGGAGSAVLVPLTKAIADRARPCSTPPSCRPRRTPASPAGTR